MIYIYIIGSIIVNFQNRVAAQIIFFFLLLLIVLELRTYSQGANHIILEWA